MYPVRNYHERINIDTLLVFGCVTGGLSTDVIINEFLRVTHLLLFFIGSAFGEEYFGSVVRKNGSELMCRSTRNLYDFLSGSSLNGGKKSINNAQT